MDRSQAVASGIMPQELFAKGEVTSLLTHRITALLAVAALSVAMLVGAELVLSSTAPDILLDTEAPFAGTWSCSLTGETRGVLTVTGWRYTLTSNGERPRMGTLAQVGGRNPKQNPALVRVESGPLKDDLGIRVGFHDERTEPENLIFNLGPGAGVNCVRA
jgi:hypothetical protein